MKKHLFTLLILSIFSVPVLAQKDTVKISNHYDTIRIGGITIIRKGTLRSDSTAGRTNRPHKKKISTAHWIFDIGFTNWTDNTDYTMATAGSYVVNRPATTDITKSDLKLRSWKSTNVNIWFIMQKLNLIKHVVNLKYGLGIELNNYRFRTDISFKEDGPNPYNSSQSIHHAFIFRDSVSLSKNKLAADYVTIPLMISFQSNPHNTNKGVGVSAGISVGYLYSSRNKQVGDGRGKQKNRGDYDLEKWKLSLIGELGIGPVRFYGSYVPNSIFQNTLNMMPYTVGIRFSNW